MSKDKDVGRASLTWAKVGCALAAVQVVVALIDQDGRRDALAQGLGSFGGALRDYPVQMTRDAPPALSWMAYDLLLLSNILYLLCLSLIVTLTIANWIWRRRPQVLRVSVWTIAVVTSIASVVYVSAQELSLGYSVLAILITMWWGFLTQGTVTLVHNRIHRQDEKPEEVEDTDETKD